MAVAASALSSGRGSASARASIACEAPAGRCARIISDGSMAITSRSGDSYEPAPAPTFATVRASPSARSMAAAMRGSVRRVAVYAAREAAYSLTARTIGASCRRHDGFGRLIASSSMLSFAILGPGGVGGFLAAALERAGREVTVVAREATAEVIARHGIRVRSVRLGDFESHP